jgi:hypothetical protein
MNPFQRVEAVLKFKNIFAAEAKLNQCAGGRALLLNSTNPVHTRDEVAKLAQTSPDTVRKVDEILQKASEVEIDALRCDEASIHCVCKFHQLLRHVSKFAFFILYRRFL